MIGGSMSKKEVIAENKLIAEFMNYHNSKQTDNRGMNIYRVKINGSNTFHTLKTMPHYSSWEWLMPVVQKIENTTDIQFIIDGDNVLIKGELNFSIAEHSKLEAVYMGVIEFIKWYNKQKGENHE
jgi:hypothetical protein